VLLHLTTSVSELFELTDRLEAAIDVLLTTTIDTFVAEHAETISQHTSRLEGFYRMVTHELRQPMGTLQFGLKMLAADDTGTTREKRDARQSHLERDQVLRSKEIEACSRNRYGTERATGCLRNTGP
jgi:hypothetical protein